MIKVGIYGATGYTGIELIQILRRHPHVQLVFASARSSAGQLLSDIYPTTLDVPIVDDEHAPLDGVDLVFCCLPHGAATPSVLRALEAGARVIDLSADFRLRSAAHYQHWYGKPHEAAGLLTEAVYGLPEVYREQIRSTRLLANPGCYPTAAILALRPLARSGLLSDASAIIDAKSGVSGAGRKLTLNTAFAEAHENFSTYKAGRVHFHIAEMEQETGLHILFTPHLLPVVRGILETIYVRVRPGLTSEELHAVYTQAYANEPFVRVLAPGKLPELRHAVNTNLCVIGVNMVDPERGTALLVAVEDNLVKGAAGQAVQNMNIMFGFAEQTALW